MAQAELISCRGRVARVGTIPIAPPCRGSPLPSVRESPGVGISYGVRC